MSDFAPTVTVVVPLYNTARYITETLRSIAQQTYRDFEVIVVNDASTDHGPDLVRAFIANDGRFRMVTQENRGLAGARNTGFRAARGRYVALLDADDLWQPRKLELHVAHLEARPQVGVSYAPSIFIDEQGRDLGLKQEPRLTGVDAAHVFCRNPVGNGSAAVMRRAALDDVAFETIAPEGLRTCWFDERFRQSEDIELWSRIAATTSWQFEGIEPALTLYRVCTTGLSADVDKQFESWTRMRDKIAAVAPDLVATCGRRSEAYQRRYLARRLAANGDGKRALQWSLKSLRLYPRMMIEEPARTVATLGVSALLALLPQRVREEAPILLAKLRHRPATTHAASSGPGLGGAV